MRHLACAFSLCLFLFHVACDRSDSHIGGSGMIEADEVLVSAETAGRVIRLLIDEGSSVEVDDTLAVIDPSRLDLQLASLEAGRAAAVANLSATQIRSEQAANTEAYAQSELDRADRLLKSGTGSQKQYDQLDHEYVQAKFARRTAEAHVLTIKAELAKIDAEIERVMRERRDCYPLSPTAGTITERFVDPGELLATGNPIAKIAHMDTVWAKIYLPTADFARIRVGDHATISTESGGRQYDGAVVWTSQEAEFTPKNIQTKESRAGLVYAVKVRIPNVDGSLKIGMPVYVTLAER